MSKRQLNNEHVLRKRRETAGLMADEIRKGPAGWDAGRLEALRVEFDRWQGLCFGYSDEALGETCRPLAALDEKRGAHWITQPPAPVPALLRSGPGDDASPLIPAGKVGLLVARGGTGKTQALTQLALSVATGLPWLDTFSVATPGRVLLVLGEEDQEETMRRIQRSARAIGPDLTEKDDLIQQAGRNVWTMPRYGLPSTLTDCDDRPSPFGENLVAHLDNAGGPWSCIILDPASRFMGAEAEKDNAAATRFVEAVERLTEAPGGPAVIVAHHTSKSWGTSGRADQGAARGSSALTDGARFVLNLFEDLDEEKRGQLPGDMRNVKYPRLRLTKANYGPHIPDLRVAVSGTGIRPATEQECRVVDEARGKKTNSGQGRNRQTQDDKGTVSDDHSDPFEGVEF